MYDEWFADGRPEVSELTANLAGNIRLDSKHTGDWVLQAQRQKLVERGGCNLQNGTRARALARSGERMESVTILASYGSQ